VSSENKDIFKSRMLGEGIPKRAEGALCQVRKARISMQETSNSLIRLSAKYFS
jgi:hypothetical protein